MTDRLAIDALWGKEDSVNRTTYTSNSMRISWQDPEIRRKRLEGRAKNYEKFEELTPEILQRVLEYDQYTGLIRWRNPSPRQKCGWFEGCVHTRNYRRVYVSGMWILVHVVAYAIMTGRFSENELDNKDRNPANNKWNNIRPATHTQNMFNLPVSKRNTTGVRGVTRFGDRFRAVIKENGRTHSLGLFDTIEEAAVVRRAAEVKYYNDFA